MVPTVSVYAVYLRSTARCLMPKPDGGIQVHRSHRHGNASDVRTHDGEFMPYGAAYAKLETWTVHRCGAASVTRRSDLTWGCCRCGQTREKAA